MKTPPERYPPELVAEANSMVKLIAGEVERESFPRKDALPVYIDDDGDEWRVPPLDYIEVKNGGLGFCRDVWPVMVYGSGTFAPHEKGIGGPLGLTTEQATLAKFEKAVATHKAAVMKALEDSDLSHLIQEFHWDHADYKENFFVIYVLAQALFDADTPAKDKRTIAKDLIKDYLKVEAQTQKQGGRVWMAQLVGGDDPESIDRLISAIRGKLPP